MIGKKISHYKILEKLGEGGMGVVYKARDTKLDRTVALKFLPSHLTKSEEDKQRFIREAKAAAALNHPHICTVYSVEEHDDSQFISMEYIDGVTLREKCRAASLVALQANEAIDYAIQIAEALSEAHGKGIVHRDIKPENIMVDSKNRIKVMDFGLAKLKGMDNLTKAGSTVGTMAYMSPEQIQGQEVDHRSDIFSFGVVLYEMLTGVTPFRGEHEAAMMYSIVNEEPDPVSNYISDVHPDLIRVTERTLDKDPDDRYQSVDHIISDIRHLKKKSSQRIATQPQTPIVTAGEKTGSAQQQPQKHSTSVTINIPALKSRTGVAAILAAVVVLGGLLYFLLSPSTPVEVPVEDQSIAVLPLQNLSPDPDDAYFADGVHDDIIIQLSQIGGIRTIARSSVLRYTEGDRNLQQIADDLNVSTVLEGNVRRAGDVIRVAVQLIDPYSNQTLWADSYERDDITELFQIQKAIAGEIASALEGSLTPQEQEQLEERPTGVAEAYELYLRGRANFFRSGATEEDYRNAEEFLKRALEYDPEFVHVHGLLSRVYSSLIWFGYDTSSETVDMSRHHAERAYDLNPDLPDALLAMGYHYYHARREYDEALEYFNTARRLQPNQADIISSIAFVERRLGRFEDSIENLDKAISLDPMSAFLHFNQGFTYTNMREYEKARSAYEATLSRFPEDSITRIIDVFNTLFWKGDTETVHTFIENFPHVKKEHPVLWLRLQFIIQDYEGMIRTVNEVPEDIYQFQNTFLPSTYILGTAYDFLDEAERARGYYEEALSTMEELYSEFQNEARYRIGLGQINAALGNEELAIEEGEKAVELMPISLAPISGASIKADLAAIYARLQKPDEAVEILRELLSIPSGGSVPFLKIDPTWDPIRDTPEFQQLIQEFEGRV